MKMSVSKVWEKILSENMDVYRKKESDENTLDTEVTLSELETTLHGTGYTAPGEGQLSYAMLRKQPEQVLKFILQLFNKI